MDQLGKLRHDFHINHVIQFLTYSDILMLSGWGLIMPIIAVFITDKINGGSVEVAGFATTIYFVIKSILQIPIAKFIDNRKGEWDDFWIMMAGSMLITVSAFMYAFATEVWHVYAIQAIYGVGGALSYPSWLAIFTRHIDKHEEGFEWSFYYTATDLGSALTAGIGGALAALYGYSALFIIVGIVSFAGSAFLFGIVSQVKREHIHRHRTKLKSVNSPA